jgi:hypothetical protein
MKLLKGISLTFAWIGTFFSPVQVQHGQNMCCAECAMMKKEDEIEVVHEEKENIEA